MGSRNTQSTPAQAPKHIYDFTKALASEVRGLLDEVGQLREQRRMLQFEIAEIMRLKSKHGAGGEYAPDWHPQIEGPPMMMMEMPPPMEEPPPPPQPAPGGWRTVHKRPERKKKPPKAIAAPTPAPVAPMPMEVPAWQNWRPNPLLAPSPALGNSPYRASPPPRQGLFGAPTPPPS